ncbi:MAG: PspC domain-containing protein [Deinococcales bacterium]|nr:PspC domain-containing protein [Deinococcales bacterium]
MQSDALRHDQRRARRPQTDRRLARSRTDRKVAGVCGGIAAFVGTSSGTVRLLYALTVPLSIGITAAGYLLLWLLIPADAAGVREAA